MGAEPYQSESYQVIDETYFKDDYENETTSVNIMDGEDSKSLTITKKLESSENPEESTVNPEPEAIQLKGNKTIKDESIGEIMKNMASSVGSFSEDFKESLEKVKYNYDMNNTKDYETEDIVNIHFLAMMDYMDNGPSIAYIGVFLIFISFIIYIFNIIINKNAV
jgi:hypothetical protein|tara:strand:+ start:513 stop:1007 length:495 start_codon:yes stop_codon:yes gene_type:complete